MRQVKILKGDDIKTVSDLQDSINACLVPVKSDDVIRIDINLSELSAVIEYIANEEYMDRICSECQYWDDSGSASAVSGLCQEHGGKRRFNCKACERFKDIRR